LGKTIICFNYFSLFDKGGGDGRGGHGGGGGGRVDSPVGGQKRDREDGVVGMEGNKNDYLFLLFINGCDYFINSIFLLFDIIIIIITVTIIISDLGTC
jgi:hypothetical protein